MRGSAEQPWTDKTHANASIFYSLGVGVRAGGVVGVGDDLDDRRGSSKLGRRLQSCEGPRRTTVQPSMDGTALATPVLNAQLQLKL